MSQMVEAKDQLSHKHITLVLLGMKNEDKCIIGNTVLQEDYFNTGQEMYERIAAKVGDQLVCIINTPDNFHWLITNLEAYSKEELTPSYPGPRVFLLVLQDNKLSREEMKMFKQLKEGYGETMTEDSLVVVVSSKEESSEEIHDRADENLRKVLDECGRRICVHNKNHNMKNHNIKNPELIKEIMDIVNKLHMGAEEHLGERLEALNTLASHKEDKTQKQVSKLNNSASGGEPFYVEIYDNGLTNQEHTCRGEHDKPSGGDYTTVVLLGKNNADKCLIGNIILDDKKFQSENITCEIYTGQLAGQSVQIIKTPDLFLSDADSMEGVRPLFQESRVFLLVLQGKTVSQEEMDMFTQLKGKFGKKMVENTIVLVKKGQNKLSSHSMDKHGVTFKSNLHKELLKECGNRVCRYNKDITNKELVNDLMKYTMVKNQEFESGTERTYDNISTVNNCVESGPAPNKSVIQEHQPPDMTVKDTTLTIVLLGQTGSGKSATGNTILGKPRFESRASSVPVTQECQIAEETVCGMKIRVIDTPDFFNEDLKNQDEQLNRCKELIQHKPVVYLLVMELGRFTDGEREVLTHLKEQFGEEVTTNTVILFTSEEKLQNKTLKDYINETDQELQQLIKTCSSRCHAFNNNKKSSHQVKKLMEIILKMQTDSNIPLVKSYHDNKKQNKLKEAKECRIL